jgi:cytochrome c oxidase cbb3-type subunit 4
VTKLEAYYHTDWAAMTATDWFGLVVTVIIFLAMIWLFYWVFSPKNKQKLEAHKTMPFEEDTLESEK